MVQTRKQRKPKPADPRPDFNFSAGTGVIRAKIGTGLTTMYFGRLALPGFGQCYVDGLSAKTDAELKLSVKTATDRKVVATLVLPRGEMETREGKIIEAGGKKKTWKVRAVIRRNADGQHRLVLRLPEVKIVQPAAY